MLGGKIRFGKDPKTAINCCNLSNLIGLFKLFIKAIASKKPSLVKCNLAAKIL